MGPRSRTKKRVSLFGVVRVAWVLYLVVIAVLFLKTGFLKRYAEFTFAKHDVAFFAGFFLVTFLNFSRSLVERIQGAMWKNRKFIVFMIIFSVLSLELIARNFFSEQYPVFSSQIVQARYLVNGVPSSGTGMYVADSYFPYKMKSNLDITLADRYYSYEQRTKTNSDGFRFFASNQSKKNLMFLGDSLTFGLGVSNGETYPDQLGRLLKGKYEIFNYGVNSWGFAEYYLAFKKYVNAVNPHIVVMGVFLENDFDDLLVTSWDGKEEGGFPAPPLRRKDIYVDDAGSLRGTFLNSRFVYGIPVLRELSSYIFIAKRIIKPIIGVIRDMSLEKGRPDLYLNIISSMAKERKMLVVILPAQFHYSGKFSPDEYVDKIKRLKNVYVLNLYPKLKKYYKDIYVDGTHFTKEGNALVARMIHEFMVKNSLL